MRNLIFILLIFAGKLPAQTVVMLTSGSKTSFRGLSVVTEKIIWASGSNGMVTRSVDGGLTWKLSAVKGFESVDFRDIEAFDSSTAIIMGTAEPAYILKTTDGGQTWQVKYENKNKGMFLDAMDFRNLQHGIVVGDPLNHKFFLAKTRDGGETWNKMHRRFRADSGEACFASSGTNVRLSQKGKIYFVSGGLRSRLFKNHKRFVPPILQGKETTGANSLARKKQRTFIIVGGDFKIPDSNVKNCAISFNGGRSWIEPAVSPHGYRSCVEYIYENNWITCGLNGIDYSNDNGKTWELLSQESFHVCRKAKVGNTVFLAGANGRIAKMSGPAFL